MIVKEVRMIDIHGAEIIEIIIQHDILWVNVDGVCHLRASKTGEVVVEDARTKQED